MKLPQVLASGSWMPSDIASSCLAVLRNSSSLLAEAISDVLSVMFAFFLFDLLALS